MIVTFCGHAKIPDSNKIKLLTRQVYEVLESEILGKPVDFYLGGYGAFDNIAWACCEKYRERHNNVRMFFITPYLDEKFFTTRQELVQSCDDVIYPELESTPKRYAIAARNKWMINNADFIIAYVSYITNGSTNVLRYAHDRKKYYINLGTLVID